MTLAAIRNVAVIDIGKTHAKVIILNADTGVETDVRKVANTVLTDGPYPHYDIDGLWSFILSALKDFAVSPGYEAISITTHGACAALLDVNGELALPVLDYEHAYPDAVRESYASIRPPFAETFSPYLSAGLNLGAQLHYQKSTFPDEFAKMATILTYPQYWAYRLTGEMASEVTSLGCHTDLWQPALKDFSSLTDTLRIASTFPPVRSAFDALGPLQSDIARSIGITGDVPVYCGLHDSNASLLPHLIARRSAFSVVSTGTWIVSFGVGGALEGLDPLRDTLVNVDAFANPVPSARFMGGREFEKLTAGVPTPSPDDLAKAATHILNENIMLLPSVVGGCGPFPKHQSGWIGAPETDAEIHVAASFYAAMMTTICLEFISTFGPIIVEGPFSANIQYLQALSSCTGREVLVTEGNVSSGTALGAALLAISTPPEQHYHAIEARLNLADYFHVWRGNLLSDA